MNWLEETRRHDVGEVADAVGLERRGNSAGCPKCGAETRGSSDARLPLGFFRAENGTELARCFGCAKTFDAVELLSYVVTDGPLTKTNHAEIRAAAEAHGLCSRSGQDCPERPRATRVKPAPARNVSPARPDSASLARLLESSRRVLDEQEVAGWLRSRGLDPADVEDCGLARALPAGVKLPPWARSSAGSWTESGHRVVLPLVDAHGQVVSVRARCVRPDVRPKALSPVGFQVGGLVLADALAQRMLAGDPAALELVVACGLVITEGDPDWLAWATRASDANEHAWATLGIFSGSWTPELASRIPDRTRVVIRGHDDEAGRKYVAQIIQGLAGRCELLEGATT